ncbi:vitamin B12 transporter BtuB [Yeosuana aromativorans]|uniref:Vitamin B12 transporter BtuB n=1 Tax=Yeosuana aromativorans TaxID=288019 RepID=A0A8J3BLH4_9FLAO|nr:TonB-dependent receptor plug domain-containing protein [Yeosuana aromativorans]GGK19771.1 vitamin B12 transporter BtuB [Yeosuana aromativorans]
MNKKTTVFGILCFGISVCGLAQQQADSTTVQQLDEVVITDSKFNLKRENSGKVITKITQADLQHQQGKSIAEIINSTVGIEINGTKSYAGQNLNYYIRGGRNRQVLVLIDGVPLFDASQISNDYDLRLLNADQVDNIEILKGASGTLYGSGAATAVINVTLKKASKKPISANFRSVLGTNQSQHDNAYYVQDFRNSVSVNGTLKKFSYLASFGNQFTDGLSSLSSIETDKDTYDAINGNLKLGYQFSKNFKTHVYASFDDFKADFDDTYSGPEIQDVSETNQHRFGMSSEFTYKKGSIILNTAYNNIKRDISSSYPAIYKAKSFVADAFNRYHFNNTFYTVLGINAQDNTMESFSIPYGSSDFEQSINPDDAKFTIIDPYANMVYISDFGLNLNAGVRLNNHSEYGSHWVYSLNPSFKKDFGFGYIKGLASYSTAYITPSLYQLFEPTYGNTNLKPEDNATIEVGTEVHLKNKATFSMVYFTRKETNFIDFVDIGNYVYQYQNVDNSFTARGVEFTTDFNILKQLKFKGNATYTKVDDKLNLRIPKFKVNALLLYDLSESIFLSMSYQFNDDRTDSVYNPSTYQNDDINLKSYNLFDFYISHKLIKNKLMLFANVTNILNEDYQELYGYSTRGRNVSLGLNINL